MGDVAEVEALFARCSRMMMTHHAAAAAGDREGARPGDRGRLSARRHLRPGRRLLRRDLRHARRQHRRLLLHARRGARPGGRPEARHGDAAHRRGRSVPNAPARSGSSIASCPRGARRRGRARWPDSSRRSRRPPSPPASRCSTASSSCRSARPTPWPDMRSRATSSATTGRKAWTPSSASAHHGGRTGSSQADSHPEHPAVPASTAATGSAVQKNARQQDTQLRGRQPELPWMSGAAMAVRAVDVVDEHRDGEQDDDGRGVTVSIRLAVVVELPFEPVVMGIDVSADIPLKSVRPSSPNTNAAFPTTGWSRSTARSASKHKAKYPSTSPLDAR